MLNLNQFSISTKLSLFFIVPLFTIIIFSLTTAHTKYQKLENSRYVSACLDVISVLDQLIYGLQKERGLTAGITSNDAQHNLTQFEDLLTNQYIINDDSILELQAQAHKFKRFFTPKLQEKWQAITSKLSDLSYIRNDYINHRNSDHFIKYSDIISHIINFIDYSQTLIEDSELSNIASSWVSLQWMKEYAGLERGEFNKALVSGRINNTDLKNIFSNIVGQQTAFTRFKNSSKDKYQSFISTQLENNPDKEVEQYRKIFFNKSINDFTENSNYILNADTQLSPEKWWQGSTKRIDSLHAGSRQIIQDMNLQSDKISSSAWTSIFLHIALALFTILVCMYLGLRIRSRLVGEISYIANTMRNNTSSNLSHEFLREQGNDEITDMVKAFNTLIRQRTENEKSLRLAAQVFKGAHEGILITDLNSRIIDVNPTFCEITGYSSEEIIGNKPSMLSSGKQSPLFYQNLWTALLDQGYWHGEIWNRRKNGELFPEILTITALKNEKDEATHYVAIFTDISEIKSQQKQLEVLAYYDPLTHLPNRTLFADRFSMAAMQSKRNNSLLAICFLDLDDFKPVNDKYGHETGDTLLVAVSERITSTLRESDSISRQGGDEFILLLGDVYNKLQIEKLLDRLLFCISQPYQIDGKSIYISVTAGVTVYPSDNSDIDTLIRHADQAMYKAKLEGKRGYNFYNIEEDQKAIKKHHHLQEIKDAISKDQFELYYQPKINMVTGQVYGVEALIRWNKPKVGLVPPLEFLPLIEGTDLDIQVGEWVMNTALKQADIWLHTGLSLQISINISAHHLLSDAFIHQLEIALSKHPNFDSEQLQVEVLESYVISDVTKVATIMKKCRRMLGINFALDDFGTGYSTLSHLRNLPADTIKIDQSFVKNMLQDNDDYSIIDGVIGLANSFGRDIIAEGVESTEHGSMLIMMGCKDAQGYGIAKPMPAKELRHWIEHQQANEHWIQLSQTSRTQTEMSLQVFQISSRHWFAEFKKGLFGQKELIPDWTLRTHTKCQCGEWIKRAKINNVFDQTKLNQLTILHKEIHNQASHLYNYALIDQLPEPQNAIKKLGESMEKMHKFVQTMPENEVTKSKIVGV